MKIQLRPGKGISNLRPPTPRYNFIWYVQQVLNQLKTYARNSEKGVKLLSFKLTILLERGSTQRGS